MSYEKRAIIEAIIAHYGTDNDIGCYINGTWLSVERIIEIIENVKC